LVTLQFFNTFMMYSESPGILLIALIKSAFAYTPPSNWLLCNESSMNCFSLSVEMLYPLQQLAATLF